MSSLFLKRVSFAGIVIIGLCLCIFFSASDANAQFRRGRYALTGSLNWEYETYRYEDNLNTRERVRFLQNYNLNLTGNIVDPRLVTFNAGLSYRLSDADIKDSSKTPQSSKDEESLLGYNLSLSFFPRSWYPFSIYGSRATGDTKSKYYPSTVTTNTTYGANMRLLLTTFPAMDMYYTATNSETKNPLYPSEFDTTTYGLTLYKRLERFWDSNITAGHASSATDDIVSRTKTSNNVYYLTDSSQISQTTLLSVSAILNDYISKNPDTTSDSQYMSLNTTLSMSPSRRFRHSYAYDYSDSKSSSATGTRYETTINTLSGNAYYLILKELPLDGRFRYSIIDTRDVDPSRKTDSAKDASTDILDLAANTSWQGSKDFSTSASMAYYIADRSGSDAYSKDILDTAWNARWVVNKNLSTGASLSYYLEDNSDSAGNNSSKESVSGTANARYTTQIRFLNFRSGYTFAYSSVSEDPGADTKTTTHAFNAGIGSSYKGRNLSASGDYNFTYTTSSRGEKADTHNISLSAVSTHIPRTTITASTDWYLGKTAVILQTTKTNIRSASLNLRSDYFRNTVINASARYEERDTEQGQISVEYQAAATSPTNLPTLGAVAVGSSEFKTTSASAGIDRYLGRFGKLSLNSGYLKTEKIGEITGGGEQTITTTTLNALHQMWLTKRLSSDVSYSRVDTTDDLNNVITSSVTTTASAALNYWIGKWSVSANYKYTLTEEIGADREEQTFLISISRTFRLFL